MKAYVPNNNGGSEIINPEYLIIHSMGEWIDTDGVDYYATDWLKHLGLSCHYLVSPTTIIKTREENTKAWHCKAQGMNYKAIGIEILVSGIHNYSTFLEAIKTPYLSPKQYDLLVNLAKEIKGRYPNIKLKRHSDIDPNKKFDPGTGFDWGKFLIDTEI